MIGEPFVTQPHRYVTKAIRFMLGQALGLLVLPSTRVTTLTHAAYQPGSLPGTLLAYAMGNLILRLASRLDAFSVYPIRT